MCTYTYTHMQLHTQTHTHTHIVILFPGSPHTKIVKASSQLSCSFPRGGHCHRCCSHSCDRGQNILTIVFVAWPLDRIANGALTIWPHTLNTNCLPFLILMAIKMQPSWPQYRVWKLSLTAWPTPKTAHDPLTASWPRSQLWLRRLWEWPPLGVVMNC